MEYPQHIHQTPLEQSRQLPRQQKIKLVQDLTTGKITPQEFLSVFQSATMYSLHPAQQQILSESKRFNVLSCGRRFGKSALGVNLLLTAVVNKEPAGYFAPTYRLLELIYNDVVSRLGLRITKKHECQLIETGDGGRIDFFSLDNPDAGRSRKYKIIVVDEAAFVRNLWKQWNEVLRPTLVDLQGSAWFMSSPRGKNGFFTLFNKSKTEPEIWASWQMSSHLNPFVPIDELEASKRDMTEIAYSQEILALFNDNVANPFGMGHIQQCTYPMSDEPPICFGIDLAKSVDWTVITGLDRNGSVSFFERFQKDWKQTTEFILGLPDVPIAIDATGVGAPIGEDVARVKDVELFIFTSISKQELMANLAVAIQKRLIQFPDNLIKQELENFEYEFTKNGVRYSAPNGFTDDCVMSLGLAFHKWENVSPLASRGPCVW